MQKIVRIEGLSKSTESSRLMFDNISFTLNKGECLAIKGPSGCGKSTLAKIMTGLCNYDTGRIDILGTPLLDWLKKQPSYFRKNVQLIFQHPFSAFPPLFPVRSYFEDTWKSHYGKITKAFEDQVSSLFHRISFSTRLLSDFPHELSGGELQRLAILRALLLNPKLLICDEITSSLDVLNQAMVFDLLKDLKEKQQMSLIIISHDTALLPEITDRTMLMS